MSESIARLERFLTAARQLLNSKVDEEDAVCCTLADIATYDDLGWLECWVDELKRPNLLQRADQLTGNGGERRSAYKHPIVDFGCTAAIMTAVLHRAGLLKEDAALQAEHIALLMVAVKLSRLSGQLDHADSALDIAGYMRCLEMIWEKRNGASD